jgi:hypothetical protein
MLVPPFPPTPNAPYSVFRDLTRASTFGYPPSVKISTVIALKNSIVNAKHVYEFDLLVDDMLDNDRERLSNAINEGREIIVEQGFMPFPFDITWYTWRERDGAGLVTSIAICLIETPDNPDYFGSIFALGTDPEKNVWHILPGVASMKRVAGHTEVEIYYLDGDLSGADSAAMCTTMLNFAGNVLGLTVMLARPGSRLENRLLHRNGQAPEPPMVCRIIHLDRVSSRRSDQAGNGHPKSPHDRAAHMRTLPSGRDVPVRCCTINGGGGRGPTIHIVED